MKGSNTITICAKEMIEMVQEALNRRFSDAHRVEVTDVSMSTGIVRTFDISVKERDADASSTTAAADGK